MLLSLSLSGSVMAGLLFVFKPLVAGRGGKRVYYYLWLLVLIRLCLPISGPVNLSDIFEGQTGTPTTQVLTAQGNAPAQTLTDMQPLPDFDTNSSAEASQAGNPAADLPQTQAVSDERVWNTLVGLAKEPGVWIVVWVAGAVLSCAWFVGGYLRFSVRVIRNSVPADSAAVRIFSELGGRARPRLLYSGLVGTPMLIGLLRPAIILPKRQYDEGTLRHILRHELRHYRSGDIYYKWFAMLVFSLHWFNPLMYVLRRELNRACELACDEAVIRTMSVSEKRGYGETLLQLAAGKKLPAGILATTMSEEKVQLKGRLNSIMTYKKASAAAAVLSMLLALLLCGCGAVLGGTGDGGADLSPAVTDTHSAPIDSIPSMTGDTEPSDNAVAAAVPEGYTALSATQLDWFNTAYFNGKYSNIRNQFLLSLYEKPEDIDLRETFYDGTVSEDDITELERAAIVSANGWETDPKTDCHKLSVSDMNAALTENMGLTLGETGGIGLDLMTYLPAYDAYYLYHGDTMTYFPLYDAHYHYLYHGDPNYMTVIMSDGYRDDMGNVYLHYSCYKYYNSNRLLHLKENGDGYLFVSNTEISGLPGLVLNADGVPDTVIDEAKQMVWEWFIEGRAQFPDSRYTNWRIESLKHDYTYDDFDGMTLHVYRMNYEYYSESPENVTLAGGMYITDDGWVMPDYPDCMYLIFRQDGNELTFFKAMMENDCAPGQALFEEDLRRSLSYAPDTLTSDSSMGIEVLLDYADDDIVVFHGYFGVFVYDLNAGRIRRAVDFNKTLGCTYVNGSVIVSVAVSDDGKTVQLYLYGIESDMADMGLDPDAAWYLDTVSGVLTKGVYEKLENPFKGLVPSEQYQVGSYQGVQFPDGMAYISYAGYTVGTLGELRYIRGDNTVLQLFEDTTIDSW